MFAKSDLLWKKDDPLVCPKFGVNLPRARRFQNVFTHYMAIRKEAEKTKLCNAAKGDLFRSNTLEPVFGYGMVNVPIRRERDPDIDIRQVDHRN